MNMSRNYTLLQNADMISRLEKLELKINTLDKEVVKHEGRLSNVENTVDTHREDITKIQQHMDNVERQISDIQRAKYIEICYIFSISTMVFTVVFIIFKLFDI